MTTTEEKTHTEECIELNRTPHARAFKVTMQSLAPHEQEIIFSCPHESHDIPKQMFHRL